MAGFPYNYHVYGATAPPLATMHHPAGGHGAGLGRDRAPSFTAHPTGGSPSTAAGMLGGRFSADKGYSPPQHSSPIFAGRDRAPSFTAHPTGGSPSTAAGMLGGRFSADKGYSPPQHSSPIFAGRDRTPPPSFTAHPTGGSPSAGAGMLGSKFGEKGPSPPPHSSAAFAGRLGEKISPATQTVHAGSPYAGAGKSVDKASPSPFAGGPAAQPAGKLGAPSAQASPGRKPWTSDVQLLLENGSAVQPKPDQLRELQTVVDSSSPTQRGEFTVCLNQGSFGRLAQPVLLYVTYRMPQIELPYVLLSPEAMLAANVTWAELASVVVGRGARAILEPFRPPGDHQRPLAEELRLANRTFGRIEGSSLLKVEATTEGKLQARSKAGYVLVAPLTRDLARRLSTLAQRAPQAGPARFGGSAAGHGGRTPVEEARLMHSVYNEGAAFPEWSIKMLERGLLMLDSTTVFYTAGSDIAKVKKIVEQREPVNIAMRRYYSEDRLQEHFGYRRGAYEQSTVDELMPNVAIYCKTPMMPEHGEPVNVHVINLIGFAFDQRDQPDYKYFFGASRGLGGRMPERKWQELVGLMTQVWAYAFECCQRNGLKYLYLTGVGGGAFSTYLPEYEALRAQSLEPVRRKYSGIVVERLPKIPDWAFTAEGRGRLDKSLLVNAWDPWSMVGNGNLFDNSLDGYFGRCTAMAVLCWPRTNPQMKWVELSKFDSGGHTGSAGSGPQGSGAAQQAAGAAARAIGGRFF